MERPGVQWRQKPRSGDNDGGTQARFEFLVSSKRNKYNKVVACGAGDLMVSVLDSRSKGQVEGRTLGRVLQSPIRLIPD